MLILPGELSKRGLVMLVISETNTPSCPKDEHSEGDNLKQDLDGLQTRVGKRGAEADLTELVTVY